MDNMDPLAKWLEKHVNNIGDAFLLSIMIWTLLLGGGLLIAVLIVSH